MTNEIEKDYLRRAYINARDLSDDPSTQNGAILVHHGWLIDGANRLPRGIKANLRDMTRTNKYSWIEHAERNVIYEAARLGLDTMGATLYVPWFACTECARAIIGAGITKVVGHKQRMVKTPEKWQKSIGLGNEMLDQAGVERVYIDADLFEGDGDYQIRIRDKYWIP